MKQLFIYTSVLLFLSIGFYSCDSTTGSQNVLDKYPSIVDFNLLPDSANFTAQEDGFKDTTLSLTLNARVQHWTSSSTFSFQIINKSNKQILLDDELEPVLETENGHVFTQELNIETTTTSIESYIVNAIVKNDKGQGNYSQTSFVINGFSNNPPVILETNSPGQITRPSEGEIEAVFTAKVTDADGQQTIESVLIRIINQESGEVTGSPFLMYDNGSTYNDQIAGDSTYTWSLPVTPTNENPNRDFDIEFFAIDSGGLISDTVSTTFSIVE